MFPKLIIGPGKKGWFIYGKTFDLKKTCASFGASTSGSHFPLRRLNLKNKTRDLALIQIESSLRLNNLTKREGGRVNWFSQKNFAQ